MIFTSSLGDIPIPQDQTVWTAMERRVKENPDKAAFICGLTERTLTFTDAYRQMNQLCAGLAAEGIKKGDVVMLHSFNCLEFPVVFMALTRLGAVCSAASPLFNAKELSDQLEHADAVAIISHKLLAKTALEAASSSGIDHKRVYTMDKAPFELPLTSVEELIAKDLPFPDLPPVDPEAVVALPFSSGTTARPKGVELTNRAIFSACELAASMQSDLPYMLGMLPFFHILATMMFHVTLHRGWTLVVLPRFDPDDFLRVVCKYKIAILSVAPPLVQFIAKHPIVDKYDLSHVAYLGSGGGALGKEVEDAVFRRIGAKVIQGYGMTEFAGAVSYPTFESQHPGSVGQLLPNTQLRVQDLDTGEFLGPNKTGELLFRTPSMMKGYYKSPEENAAAFTEDGFARTGDVGYIDDDGYLFIVDRVKEMIKYKGHQVAPAELEDVLHMHPAVADSCCVRGKDHATGEEIPKAFVSLRDNAEPVSAEELMEFVSAKVAGYKRVREVEFIDSIPRSLSGKVLRRQLQVKQNEKNQIGNQPGSHL